MTIIVHPAHYTEQQLVAMYASIAQAFPEHDADDVREAADFACVSPEEWQEDREQCRRSIAAYL